jgi:exopolyphosphatase/guanosine-5'-triphosphate,3'-diphosphate pyrophosphatase
VKVGAIDIGTNTVLLLIAESDGGLHAELELATITRLGEGVDRTRCLSNAASARTLDCLRRYREVLDAHGVHRVDVVGTSALRDARGGAEFVKRAAGILEVLPRVISGSEEARLTFEGSLLGLNVAGNVIVFDVGGGSTEIIIGHAKPDSVAASVSLEAGSVRLFERHVHDDPLSLSDQRRIVDDVRHALEQAPRPTSGAALVGVAGTVTQLAALHLELDQYDGARVHGSRLGANTLRSLTLKLEALDCAGRRALRGMDPGRADVSGVGARIVFEILEWAKATEIIASDRGVRWGVAARLAAGNVFV